VSPVILWLGGTPEGEQAPILLLAMSDGVASARGGRQPGCAVMVCV